MPLSNLIDLDIFDFSASTSWRFRSLAPSISLSLIIFSYSSKFFASTSFLFKAMISLDSVRQTFEESAGIQAVFSIYYSKLLFTSIFLTVVICRLKPLLNPPNKDFDSWDSLEPESKKLSTRRVLRRSIVRLEIGPLKRLRSNGFAVVRKKLALVLSGLVFVYSGCLTMS